MQKVRFKYALKWTFGEQRIRLLVVTLGGFMNFVWADYSYFLREIHSTCQINHYVCSEP